MYIGLDDREIYIIRQALGDFIDSTHDLSEYYNSASAAMSENYGKLSLDAQNLLDRIDLMISDN